MNYLSIWTSRLADSSQQDVSLLTNSFALEEEEFEYVGQPRKAYEEESGLLSGPLWGRPNVTYLLHVKCKLVHGTACIANSQAARSRVESLT